jgi:hypothetical protein
VIVKAAMLAAVAAAVVAFAPAPVAHAYNGLSYCTEDTDTLVRKAEAAIRLVAQSVPLGPYESSSTVLQFINKSYDGNGEPIDCGPIMTTYAVQRIKGTIAAPRGPGLS